MIKQSSKHFDCSCKCLNRQHTSDYPLYCLEYLVKHQSHKPHPSQREEGSGHSAIGELSPRQKLDGINQIRALRRLHWLSWSTITSCFQWMSASYYLTAMVDICIPLQQLGSCSMTRPFLSLRRVWLARLVKHKFNVVAVQPYACIPQVLSSFFRNYPHCQPRMKCMLQLTMTQYHATLIFGKPQQLMQPLSPLSFTASLTCCCAVTDLYNTYRIIPVSQLEP